MFVGSETCSIGQWIQESGGGWVVAPGDIEGLEQAIKEASDPAERRKRGEATVIFSEATFGRGENRVRYAKWLARRAEVRTC